MKGYIIPEQCIACGRCQLIAKAIFDYDDEGIALFVHNGGHEDFPINDQNQQEYLDALRACPTGAIKINRQSNAPSIDRN